MLLLGPEARDALRRARAIDARLVVAFSTAAELHLGRAPSLPVVVASTAARAAVALVQALAPVSGVPRDVVAFGDLRVTTLERTIVDLAARALPPRGSIALAGELVRGGSTIERRAVDAARLAALALRSGRAGVCRRVGYLLERAGHRAAAEGLRAAAHGGALKLDPALDGLGAVLARWKLDVNTADGFAGDADVAATLAAAMQRAHPGTFARIACLVAAGARLTRERVTKAGLPSAAARTLDALARGGFVVATERGLVAAPPFDAACRVAAARMTTAARRATLVAFADALAQTSDAAAIVDAAFALAAAGAAPRARSLVARHVDALCAGADRRELALVVDRIGEGDEAYGRARAAILERIGRLDDVARSQRERLARTRGPARVPLLLAASRVAWRRGRAREARALLAEAERACARRGVAVALRIEAALVGTALAIEKGAYASARRGIAAAMALAEESGRDLDRARCLHRLGTIEARRGRPSDASAAYRAALAALATADADTRALRGVLSSNLALMELWLGRFDAAEHLTADALALKRDAGTPGEVLVTRVLAARIARARGEPPPPEGRMPALALEADAIRDPRLAAEVWLDVAEELARGGDVASAEQAVERARARVVALAGAEPILDLLLEHVGGLVTALGGDPERGAEAIAIAANGLAKREAWYWVARARRDAASAWTAAESTGAALRELDAAVEIVRRSRFELGEDAAHAPLYATAALEGEGHTRAFADQALARLGAASARALLVAAGRRALADRLRDRPAPERPRWAAALARGAAGERWIGAHELARLRRGAPATVVLDETREQLVIAAESVPLRRLRVLAPLLRALAAAGEAVGVERLARDVWGRRDSASTRAAVKMNVSRLRALLGPLGGAIESTSRRGQLAYAWSPAVELVVVSEA